MTELEKVLAKEIESIRQKLSNVDEGELHIEIEVNGRVNTGEIKVTFQVGESYDCSKVKGDSLDACVSEFLRRKGWHHGHSYLALPKPQLIDDEIPF